MWWAAGASVGCWKPTACARSNPARLCRAPPIRIRPCAPVPTAPNRVWVGDITYLPRQDGGWLYLAVWLDRCSRKVVGWDVRDTVSEALGSEALRRALAVRWPPVGLVVHSDQGSQYTATRFKALLALHGAEQEPAWRLKQQRLRRIILEPLQSRTARRQQLPRPSRSQARN